MSEDNITKFQPDPGNPPTLSAEELARLYAMTDPEVEEAAWSDPDAHPLSEDMLNEFERVPDTKTIKFLSSKKKRPMMLPARRLQVFISSTFTDLIVERQAAVEAILTAGHIPAGMELFTAGDQSQMNVIKNWIDESDAYMLILGGKYGSIEPTSGKSYTHLEYEYAVEIGKPVFAVVITGECLDEKVKTDGRGVIETENPQKLKEFRELVQSKIVKFWTDSRDIKIAIYETMSEFGRREDLIGWVPRDQIINTVDVSEEITRLSKENALFREQLEGSQYSIFAGSWDELITKFERRYNISFADMMKSERPVDVLGGNLTGFTIKQEYLDSIKKIDQLRILILNPSSVFNTLRAQDRSVLWGRQYTTDDEAGEIRRSIQKLGDNLGYENHAGIEYVKKVKMYSVIPHNAIYRLGNWYFVNTYIAGRGDGSPAFMVRDDQNRSTYCKKLRETFDGIWNGSSSEDIPRDISNNC